MNDLAKVSRNGHHQIVILPKAFEVEASELRLRREGRNLVLEPVEQESDWIDRLEPLTTTPPAPRWSGRAPTATSAATSASADALLARYQRGPRGDGGRAAGRAREAAKTGPGRRRQRHPHRPPPRLFNAVIVARQPLDLYIADALKPFA